MTFDIDTIETAGQSATATVCENAALFGATPERDEFDTRDVWDEDDAIAAVAEAFRIMAEGVTPDGTQLADERGHLLWGFVNMLHAQTQRLDRAVDKLTPELRDLQRQQDGSEIKSLELELVIDRLVVRVRASIMHAAPLRAVWQRPSRDTRWTTPGGEAGCTAALQKLFNIWLKCVEITPYFSATSAFPSIDNIA